MFNQFLLLINMWMTDTFVLAVLGCFLWGIVSVLFSPCHLASIPLMVAMWQDKGTRYTEGKRRDILVCLAWGYFSPSPWWA